MKKEISGAGVTLMKIKSSGAGAGARFIKRSSGAGAVSFLRRLRSPGSRLTVSGWLCLIDRSNPSSTFL